MTKHSYKKNPKHYCKIRVTMINPLWKNPKKDECTTALGFTIISLKSGGEYITILQDKQKQTHS